MSDLPAAARSRPAPHRGPGTLWGLLVIADSPQFSELAARHAPAELTGTGLTAMNSLGFAVSVISIVILQSLIATIGV
ncbi:hypothetical protein, partial [Limosilactobacillus reuteri]|uniref:hypothetical protein n=1 Tax=Limosilactobacillus reuteri TaxID=1598 RepID=UPI00195CD00D